MKCPSCGLIHPPQYDECVSCGAPFHQAPNEPKVATRHRPVRAQVVDEDDDEEAPRRSRKVKRRGGLPATLGILIAVTVLLISAGATIFFLTRPSQDRSLYGKGQDELSRGQ